MTRKQIEQALVGLLSDCARECQLRMPESEIRQLARLHAQVYSLELRGDKSADALRMAFLYHRRECPYFPRPAEILAHLPVARLRMRVGRLEHMCRTLKRDRTKTPGYGQILSAMIRGAGREVEELAREFPEAWAKIQAESGVVPNGHDGAAGGASADTYAPDMAEG